MEQRGQGPWPEGVIKHADGMGAELSSWYQAPGAEKVVPAKALNPMNFSLYKTAFYVTLFILIFL